MEKPILLYVLLLYFSFSFLCFVFLLYISALCFCSDFSSFVLGFSSPFIEIQQLASNQSYLCRTVIFHKRDRAQEMWSTIGSDLLQIFSSLVESGWRRRTTVPKQWCRFGRNGNFHFNPCLWKFNNWIPNNFAIEIISLKSLKYSTVYKTVLNS